jgi:hypothetical protein
VPELKKEPFLKVLSEDVQVKYGWKDAHVVVRVQLPVPMKPWFPVEIQAKDIIRFKTPFHEAFVFGQKSEEERKKAKEPVEFEARKDCRGRYGYPDAHVELEVWRVRWIKLEFTFEEFKLAKGAMDEAYAWAQLPEEIRELQGVP